MDNITFQKKKVRTMDVLYNKGNGNGNGNVMGYAIRAVLTSEQKN